MAGSYFFFLPHNRETEADASERNALSASQAAAISGVEDPRHSAIQEVRHYPLFSTIGRMPDSRLRVSR